MKKEILSMNTAQNDEGQSFINLVHQPRSFQLSGSEHYVHASVISSFAPRLLSLEHAPSCKAACDKAAALMSWFELV